MCKVYNYLQSNFFYPRLQRYYFRDCQLNSQSYLSCRIAYDENKFEDFNELNITKEQFDELRRYGFYFCMTFFNAETYTDETGEVVQTIPYLNFFNSTLQLYSVARDVLQSAVEICTLGTVLPQNIYTKCTKCISTLSFKF